jgi:hypothetical protein
MTSTSLAGVAKGHIVVEPSFADSLLCPKPGGRWDVRARAYVFPATEAQARMLRARLRGLRTTVAFDALLGPVAAAVREHFDNTPPEQVVANVEALDSGAEPGMPIYAGTSSESPPEPEIVIPGILSTPWRHQGAAYRFAQKCFAAGRTGVLLAMGMGTGKSLVACMLLLALGAVPVGDGRGAHFHFERGSDAVPSFEAVVLGRLTVLVDVDEAG